MFLLVKKGFICYDLVAKNGEERVFVEVESEIFNYL